MTTTPSRPALRIFISHSSTDNDFARKLVRDLRNEFDKDAVWYDLRGGLKGGDEWWPKIIEELTARNVFILILSPEAMKSYWVLKELDMAVNERKRIIPLLYRPCEMRADLKTLQFISFEGTYLKDLKKLLKLLEGQTPGAAPPSYSVQQAISSVVQDEPVPVVKSRPETAKPGRAGALDKITFLLPSQPVPFTLVRTIARVTGHQQSVHGIAISPDGQTLASGSDDKTIKLWNLHTGALLRTMPGKISRILSKPFGQIAISSDGRLLANGGRSAVEQPIKIWDLHTGELLRTIHIKKGGVQVIAFSPVGPILASSSWGTQPTELWDPYTGELLRTLRKDSPQNHSEDIRCLAFSPNGQTLACGGTANRWTDKDSLIALWNPHTGELLRTIAGNSRSFTAVAFSPDGQFLAGAEEKRQGTIELWNPHTGELLRTLSKICHVSEYTMERLYGEFSDQAIAFSPDGQFLASTDTQHQGTIKLWNPHTGEPLCITETEGGLGNPLSLAFSPDGQLLVSGYSGGTIYIWKKTNSA